MYLKEIKVDVHCGVISLFVKFNGSSYRFSFNEGEDFDTTGKKLVEGGKEICELSLALEKDAKQMSRDDLEGFYISNGGY